ncbi:hypothetical protein GJW-30_1_01215 [Variibacter gotjawalensis]|uniref:Curli production assembly/transport component CsgG n=1 Tax=Variibacter gotjawalensis TaxID=1333996 RepID=A0A0S3PS62_9BRAD|nr:hypothetical protein [Variibacter gotjawalensis]NIK48998.1 hypothetical protein [Variibacter gotjawalensis]RZS50854.1 hypothetical protein EV661_3325 [Variibacter gotjawalensis]BAT58688.1 hypothetical protein GJW-30_1_01215 [Variibacter gotjawalensis]
MRLFPLTLTACAVLAVPALAQNRPAQQPTGPSTHYFQLSGEIMDDPSADAYLIEKRNGGRVTSAQLDICYAVTPASNRKDRFVVELTPNDGRLVGTATSQEAKSQIAVRLTREAAGNAVGYDGTITRDGATSEVTSHENSAITEDEFRNSQVVDTNIVAEPKDFSEVSPEAIFAHIERRVFADVIKLLRSENVRVTLDSLIQDCGALRSGRQFIRVDVDPLRAAALVTKLRGTDGVVNVGWTVGSYSLDNAIAFDPAEYPSAEGRQKLVAAATPAIAKFLKAQPDGGSPEPATGVTNLRFKRANTTVPGLDLTDTIEVALIVGSDRPVGGKQLLLWVGSVTVATTDTGPEPRLGIVTSSGGSEGEASGDTVDSTGLATAVAQDMKGRTWDAERSVWK